MPTAKMIYNLPEEQEEFNDSLNGGMYKGQIADIWEEVFRKYLKYGSYGTYGIDELLAKLPNDDAYKLIEGLGNIYCDITRED